jgi:hypothetical protein
MPLEHRPDDDVIDEDERLDSWHNSFIRSQARIAGRKGNPKFSFDSGGPEDFQVPQFGV